MSISNGLRKAAAKYPRKDTVTNSPSTPLPKESSRQVVDVQKQIPIFYELKTPWILYRLRSSLANFTVLKGMDMVDFSG